MRASEHVTPTTLAAIVLALACGREPGPVGPAMLSESDPPSLSSSQFGEWSTPVNLGPVVNSPLTDNSPELSKDGLSLYFGSVNRPGGFGSTDLYVSQRACTDMNDERCAWGTPVNLGPMINTSSIDGGPHLSRDGHWLYLISDRPGGFGSNDIWVSWRDDIHDDFAWEAAVNLGAPINTADLEAGPNLRGPDFYFHRGPAVGNTDIYVSRMHGNTFDEPTLVPEVSSPGFFDQRPSTRWDGHEMILSSDRPGGLGLQDIYVSTRQSNGVPWTTPVNLGAPINTQFQEQTPTITDDGTILLFSSNRTGNFDLYMAARIRKD
jgi:Tol biopolymer transport system component